MGYGKARACRSPTESRIVRNEAVDIGSDLKRRRQVDGVEGAEFRRRHTAGTGEDLARYVHLGHDRQHPACRHIELLSTPSCGAT